MKGRAKSRAAKRLAWQRWLVMAMIGVVITFVEISAHAAGQGHHYASNADLLMDPELQREVLMFGLAVPLLAGTLLTFLERTGVERDRIASELDYRRVFSKTLSGATCLDELSKLIIKLPVDIAGASTSILAVKRKATNDLEMIASWHDNSLSLPGEDQSAWAFQCEDCIAGRGSPRSLIPLTCAGSFLKGDALAGTRQCLPLATADRLVGVLIFEIPQAQPLTIDQASILNDLAPEMAMAIKNAELQLAESSWIAANEVERQRIARNLHDTLAQNVSYLRLKLDQMSSGLLLSDIAEIQEELARMRLVADEAYGNVRNALAGLRGTTDDFTRDLRQQAAKVADRAKLTLAIHEDGQPRRIPAVQHRQLLYIFNEALNNVEKHASAKRVDVDIIWRQRQLTIRMQDDGVGFDPAVLAEEDGHYGLLIMNERAQAIGGDLIIASNHGEGSTVTLMLPMEQLDQSNGPGANKEPIFEMTEEQTHAD